MALNAMPTAEKTITPRIMAVRLDVTEYYEKDWLAERKISKVHELYVYNESSHTNCCELTPSYELRLVATQYCWVGDGPDTDERRDEIADEFNDADAQSPEYSYMHVSVIDRIQRNVNPKYGHVQRFLVYSKADCQAHKFESAEEALEKAWEYLRGNEM